MKQRELREHTRCDQCDDRLLGAGVPLFWTVTVERYVLDLGAVQRQDGLAAMLGVAREIADAMGPDEDMATSAMRPVKMFLCDPCALDNDVACLALERPEPEEDGDE